MRAELIQLYGYSNLYKALLVNLYADIIARDERPIDAFHAFRSDVLHDLRSTSFPLGDPNSGDVQRSAIEAVSLFFREIESKLIQRGTLKPGDIAWGQQHF